MQNPQINSAALNRKKVFEIHPQKNRKIETLFNKDFKSNRFRGSAFKG